MPPYKSYNRPNRRRSNGNKKSHFKPILKGFLVILLISAVIFGFYKVTPLIAKLSGDIKRPQWTYFQVNDIVVKGTDDETALDITDDISYNENGIITYKDVAKIKRELLAKYTNFEKIEVSRKYLTKNLYIKVKPRKPIAKTCEGEVCHYIDGKGFVYKDEIQPSLNIIDLKIEEGASNLDKKFVQLIVELTSLNKKLNLNVETLVLQVEQENAKLILENNITLNLGTLENSEARLKKAKKIIKYLQEEHSDNYTLNLKYFENGKIYLNLNK
ncbi:MAG: hypothetical protein HOB19_03710 [Elusimicrobiaceae bacterium]|nr:hypothetical protein [Elusimicrobiaceae bacterium]